MIECVGKRKYYLSGSYVCEFNLFGKRVGLLTFFPRREVYSPWADLDYSPWPRKYNKEVDIVTYLVNLVGPGGKVMISYESDEETRKLLLRGIPPQITPLGFSMVKSGITWFKDWYFAEGGNEGNVKLQGNVPLHESERKRQLLELLEEIKNYGDALSVKVKRYINDELNRR
ncbi:hypothetical protein HS7_05630 [Sulfolobales archaeon HS-7]|nr:hypothetical protein HS7_05630 [Sulfolobales archaeon HS-7]